MFSSKALAFSSQIFLIRCFIALCLVLMPQTAWAQTGETSEDPPPVWYWPGAEVPSQSSVESYICRNAFDGDGGGLFCAGEVGFEAATPFEVAGLATMFTFELATHETLSLRTLGGVDTHGRLFDANGALLSSDDDTGEGRNFRITRTLGPGRYYLAVAGSNGDGGRSTLRMNRLAPLTWIGSAPSANLAVEIGNHCGRPAAIASFATIDSSFERAGDIDVFLIELDRPGDLLIDVDAAARYELKAADCTSSLGLASSSLGSTLTTLDAGTYYLYLSPDDGATGEYTLRTELR